LRLLGLDPFSPGGERRHHFQADAGISCGTFAAIAVFRFIKLDARKLLFKMPA